MINLVFGIEGEDQNSVIQELEFYDCKGRNVFIPRNLSEKVLLLFIQRLLRQAHVRQTVTMLTATRNGETHLFYIREIRYLESQGNFVNIVTEREVFEYYGSLTKIEPAIVSLGFLRIHGSFLISTMHIHSFSARCVVMDDGKEINIGRVYLNGFRKTMGKMKAVRI